jgi:hypothetical protein
MCTVSAVRFGDGVRLVCNRDELRARPAARPPGQSTVAAGAIAFPIDPLSGGTWAGARGGAFAAALLNRSIGGAAAVRRAVSRGMIVPALLSCASFDLALDAARSLDPSAFAPFTLLIVDGKHAAVVSTRDIRSPRLREVVAPLMLTSSSLGDAFVDAPRRALFDVLVRRVVDPLRGQHVFHRHRWPNRRDISVVVARADAQTVSRTTIDVTPSGATITYEDSPC